MAVTAIWPIKGRVGKVIDYARNPEKVHESSYEEQAALKLQLSKLPEITSMCHNVWSFHVGSGDLNSAPQARVPNTLSTEPST